MNVKSLLILSLLPQSAQSSIPNYPSKSSWQRYCDQRPCSTGCMQIAEFFTPKTANNVTYNKSKFASNGAYYLPETNHLRPETTTKEPSNNKVTAERRYALMHKPWNKNNFTSKDDIATIIFNVERFSFDINQDFQITLSNVTTLATQLNCSSTEITPEFKKLIELITSYTPFIKNLPKECVQNNELFQLIAAIHSFNTLYDFFDKTFENVEPESIHVALNHEPCNPKNIALLKCSQKVLQCIPHM